MLQCNSIDVLQFYRYVESGDETEILRDGYWASYNVPFFEKVYNMSGYPEAAKKDGPNVTYQLCPSNVKDLASMEYIMRYNGERLSKGGERERERKGM